MGVFLEYQDALFEHHIADTSEVDQNDVASSKYSR